MKKLLMANEAFAHAALEAGVRVVAGYPGTPSSELVETVAACVRDGSAEGVHVEWSTNEKAALELAAGASYAGARALFTCKQMGLNVASDALLSLNYVGVEGGCVVYAADDPGPISSQTEQDTRRFAAFAKVPVLDPADVEQGMDMMRAAFELSERYRTPVILRPTTRVCHSSTFVEVAEYTQAGPAKGFSKDDSRWVIFPARAYRGHCEINERLEMIAREGSGEFADAAGTAGAGACAGADAAGEAACVPPPTPSGRPAADLSRFNPIEQHGDAPRLGIVCGGVSCAYAREALAMLAARTVLPAYRFMQVGTPFPFPEGRADRFADGLERIIVFEELDSVLEDELVRLMGLRAARGAQVARVEGRRSGAARAAGENDVDDILSRLAVFLGVAQAVAAGMPSAADGLPALTLPVRPPVLCPGCPHRGAFYACKRAVKKLRVSATFSGDIGCYTLGNARPLDAVDTCLCMGAGITMAQGLGVAEPGVKQLAFVGDSTFFASGLTGVANAAFNRHDVTVCVLDNSTTAMTGGQPHPGTGSPLMGGEPHPLSIEAALEALGVQCIEHANPQCIDESVAAVERAVAFEGLSAVVFRAPCVNVAPRGEALAVDAKTCVGCRRCINEIGCPGIGFDGARAFVDASLCNGCGLCAQLCPAGAIGAAGGSDGDAPASGGAGEPVARGADAPAAARCAGDPASRGAEAPRDASEGGPR